jgi:dTDP-4-amino-4,6-dideoxygalactose transaminase
MHVRYSPLGQQYADPEPIFKELRELVLSGDFTLGKPVAEFEAMFAKMLGVKHAIGVGSGTDACKIPLKALGLGPGDEVITCANTFWATVGAINEVGAKPVFVECTDNFCIDDDRIERVITPKTKAIMPVHLTGDAVNMEAVLAIANKYNLPVVEDGCQSLLGEINGKKVGTFGIAAAFSMHPLKIINVWGDAGIIVTNDDALAEQCKLLRNHGLKNRDEMILLGYNTRLDSTQAVVGKYIVPQTPWIVEQRAKNAKYLDAGLQNIPGIRIPERNPNVKHVYLLYILFAEQRDALLKHCIENGIEAKIHYPIPLYQQKALDYLGHKPGDFPVTDRHAKECITFPVDQHMSTQELDFIIETVRNFYLK